MQVPFHLIFFNFTPCQNYFNAKLAPSDKQLRIKNRKIWVGLMKASCLLIFVSSPRSLWRLLKKKRAVLKRNTLPLQPRPLDDTQSSGPLLLVYTSIIHERKKNKKATLCDMGYQWLQGFASKPWDFSLSNTIRAWVPCHTLIGKSNGQASLMLCIWPGGGCLTRIPIHTQCSDLDGPFCSDNKICQKYWRLWRFLEFKGKLMKRWLQPCNN